MKIYRYILIQNGSKCYDIDWCVEFDEDDPLIDELIKDMKKLVRNYFLTNRALFQFCYEAHLWSYQFNDLPVKSQLKPYLWICYGDRYPHYIERPYFFRSKLEFEQRCQAFYELYGYPLRSKILYRSPFQK